MADRVDVAIVGAGAAGIAAARRVIERGCSALLIETLPRLGGRAHTEMVHDLPLDFGCGWLHSAERNPLRVLAEETGQIIDRSEGAWRRQLHDVRFSAEEQHLAWIAYERFRARLHADPPASDRAGDALPLNDRWRPFVDGLSSFINGAELDRLSVADFLAYDDAASENNWRLPGGYGAFITGLAAEIPASLGTTVTSMGHGADGVVLETSRGAIQARAVIVTVSSTVLARGTIRFIPEVDEHLHAASNLPLGLADKIFFLVAEPDAVPAESHLLGRLDRAGTGSYYLRPFGRPLVEAFLGGELARSLEQGGKSAAVEFALGELRDLLGARFTQALTPLAITRWAHEPSIGGSYSHALPGCAAARKVLARPVSERLCFAGEACSPHDYSTAHGAWESGLAAADWIADGLARHRGASR